MKFQFRFESVLSLRQRKEDIAQTEYLRAKAKVDLCLHDIKAIYDQISEARALAHSRSRSQASGQLAALQVGEEFIKGSQIKIEQKRKEARELMQIAETKLEILQLAIQEKKVIEKLKEKKKAEFRKAKAKKEREFFGDLAVLRAGRVEK